MMSILTFVETIRLRCRLGQELVDQALIRGSKILVAIKREGDLDAGIDFFLQDDVCLH
jgi:hypothetical protein